MPLMKCSKDGKSGWKFGDSGHCYIGPGAKKQAARQGAAIEISKKQRGEASSENFQELIEELDFVEKTDLTLAYNLASK